MLQEKEYFEIPIDSYRERITLFINKQSSNARLFEVSDDELINNSFAKYQLIEGSTYTYEIVGENHHTLQLLKIPSSDIIKHHSSSKRHPNEGTIFTSIYVGQLNLSIWDKTIDEEVGKIALEIRSIKSDYERDYRKMLDDIAEYYTELVLQQSSPVTQHLEIDENTSPKTLYQRFSFVRSIIDNDSFSEAIHKIISSPVRKWTEAYIQKSIVAVKRLSRKNIKQIATDHNRILLTSSISGMNNLSSVPRNIEVEYKKDSIDNQENQFVKFVLRSFSIFCSDIKDLKNASERLKIEAENTINKLSTYLDNHFFKQISLPTHLNYNSPVLQRKEGYREVLQSWLLFDLAAKLNWDGGEDVYEAGKKNVATLYEYWLFFKLLELISEFFDLNPEDKDNLVKFDEDGIDLNIIQGKTQMIRGVQKTFSRKLNVVFYYNRTFTKLSNKEESIKKAGSWTMTMRPDYTLSIWPGEISQEEAEAQDLITHVHFDAKYRLNKIILEDNNNDVELKNEKEQQELNIYKRGDLLKMHAYKDAIRRTSGAYVLYPGTENRTLRGFHEIVPGLGAFSIRPGHWGEDSHYLKTFLSEIKAHLLNRTSDREKLSYYHYDILNAHNDQCVYDHLPESTGDNRDFLPDETYVILGYLKNNAHLNWVIKNSIYNSRAGQRQGTVSINAKIVSAKYLLLHDKNNRAYFFKLQKVGTKIYGYKELKNMNYPFGSQYNTNNIYLMFNIDKNGLEEEFKKYVWNISKITILKGINRYKLNTIKLTDLIKYATTI